MRSKKHETPEQRELRLAKGAEYRRANRAKLNAQAAIYREANRERCYAVTKEWQDKHPERMKEIKSENYQRHKARYYKANREFVKRNPSKSKQYQRTYFLKNREVILEKIAKWHAAHPESRQAAFSRRRAAMRGVETGCQKEMKKWLRNIRRSKCVKCHWCGVKMIGRKCHIDHVVPVSKGGGHVIENLCASCPPCNQRKFTKMPEVFNRELAQPLLFT